MLDATNITLTWEWASSLFLGKREHISLDGLRQWAVQTLTLINEVHSASLECAHGDCLGGSVERVAGKKAWVVVMRENMWIPTFACAVYVIFVHLGPSMVKKPQPVKWLLSLWNLFLAVFSAVGSYHCMGALIYNLRVYGFRYTCCQLPDQIDLQGTQLDIWVSLFVLSKIGEFVDTVLKILLKKKFIFLHWYHHTMTAWLGWLSLAYDAAPGQWYAGLNFTVHAPMYTYFFLSSVLNKGQFTRYLRPVAPFITTIQITQMCAFVFVNVAAGYYKFYGGDIPESHDSKRHIESLNLHVSRGCT